MFMENVHYPWSSSQPDKVRTCMRISWFCLPTVVKIHELKHQNLKTCGLKPGASCKQCSCEGWWSCGPCCCIACCRLLLFWSEGPAMPAWLNWSHDVHALWLVEYLRLESRVMVIAFPLSQSRFLSSEAMRSGAIQNKRNITCTL